MVKPEQTNKKFSPELKRHFLEIVSTYNKYQEMMDRKSDIIEVAETLGGIVEAATQLAVNEQDEWFDKHTVKRNMSELQKLGTQFDKVVVEAKNLDQRLSGLYEDMGHILSRYYKLGEIDENTMKKRLGINEACAHGVKYSKDGYVTKLTSQNGKTANTVNVDDQPYRYNSVCETYNSIHGNELLHKSDIEKAKTVVSEGAMSEIDIIAQQSKDFKTFVKNVLKEFPTLPKDKGTMSWLADLYNGSTNESMTNEAKAEGKWVVWTGSSMNPKVVAIKNSGRAAQMLMNKIGNSGKYDEYGTSHIDSFKRSNPHIKLDESLSETNLVKTKVDKKDVLSKDETPDGNYFVVAKRDTEGMRGSQDGFSMCVTDKNLNVIKHIGSHPSSSGARKYGKNKGLIKEVDKPELSEKDFLKWAAKNVLYSKKDPKPLIKQYAIKNGVEVKDLLRMANNILKHSKSMNALDVADDFIAQVNEIKTPKSKPNPDAKKRIKGMFKLKAAQFGQLNDFVYYDKKTKKWWFVDFEGNLMELRNEYYLKQINDYISKNQLNINESVKESINEAKPARYKMGKQAIIDFIESFNNSNFENWERDVQNIAFTVHASKFAIKGIDRELKKMFKGTFIKELGGDRYLVKIPKKSNLTTTESNDPSVNEIKFNDKQLDILRNEYEKINKIDPSKPTYTKLTNMLDTLDKNGLKQLASANIKWVSMLAKNRMKRNENINEYDKSAASYIGKHKDEFKLAQKLVKKVGKDEVKFYDELEHLHDKLGHVKYMIWLSNALRGYQVDMYKDPKIKNKAEAEEALFLLSK